MFKENLLVSAKQKFLGSRYQFKMQQIGKDFHLATKDYSKNICLLLVLSRDLLPQAVLVIIARVPPLWQLQPTFSWSKGKDPFTW